MSSQKCRNLIQSTPVYLESQKEISSPTINCHHPKFKLIDIYFAINYKEVHPSSKEDSGSDINLDKNSVGVQPHWLEDKKLKECSIEFKQEDATNEHRAAENSPALDLQKEADTKLEEVKIQSFWSKQNKLKIQCSKHKSNSFEPNCKQLNYFLY